MTSRPVTLPLAVCLLVASLLALLAACSDKAAPPVEEPPAALRIVNSAGKTARLTTLEVADTSEERSVGLSKRASLDENAGMLFVFERRGLGFWMKDTTIPLSVAFIANCGEIVHIADMQPLSLQLINPREEYGFGLEVNQGWFARNEVAVGDEVVLPADLQKPECSAS